MSKRIKRAGMRIHICGVSGIEVYETTPEQDAARERVRVAREQLTAAHVDLMMARAQLAQVNRATSR